MRREALFDLAVGSLFHEAMKFRENFYQREVYGPRVRALRTESGGENAALFHEFEKILSAVAQRLEEGLHESEALLVRTREQLALLLAEHRSNGFVARCLIENRADVEDVFEDGSRRAAARRSTGTLRQAIASPAARISRADTSRSRGGVCARSRRRRSRRRCAVVCPPTLAA